MNDSDVQARQTAALTAKHNKYRKSSHLADDSLNFKLFYVFLLGILYITLANQKRLHNFSKKVDEFEKSLVLAVKVIENHYMAYKRTTTRDRQQAKFQIAGCSC